MKKVPAMFYFFIEHLSLQFSPASSPKCKSYSVMYERAANENKKRQTPVSHDGLRINYYKLAENKTDNWTNRSKLCHKLAAGSGWVRNLFVFNVEVDHFMVRFTWGGRVLDSVMEEVAGVPNCWFRPFPVFVWRCNLVCGNLNEMSRMFLIILLGGQYWDTKPTNIMLLV